MLLLEEHLFLLLLLQVCQQPGVGFGSLGGKSTQTLKSVLGSSAPGIPISRPPNDAERRCDNNGNCDSKLYSAHPSIFLLLVLQVLVLLTFLMMLFKALCSFYNNLHCWYPN